MSNHLKWYMYTVRSREKLINSEMRLAPFQVKWLNLPISNILCFGDK